MLQDILKALPFEGGGLILLGAFIFLKWKGLLAPHWFMDAWNGFTDSLNSPGGTIGTFATFYDALRGSGVPVVLKGICISACTLILELPKTQVCVEPTASLGFHLAVNGETNTPDPEMTSALIWRYYPPAVQAWLATKQLSPAVIFMSAKEIVALNIFDPCQPT